MTTVSVQATEEAISAALDFLVSHQLEDGRWVDWELPPGESDAWTTAYVGLKLTLIPNHLKARAEPAIQRAALWMLKHVYPQGGWGYNKYTGSDADSTAFSILFLKAAGKCVPVASREFLLNHQKADGGFATYLVSDTDNSWGTSHPDVTPVVLKALLTWEGRRSHTINDGIKYIMNTRTTEGTWNSFWWNTPLYSTEATISFITAAGVKWDPRPTINYILTVKASNAFEEALRISSLFHLSIRELQKRILEMVTDLIAKQQADGSWESQPILRVTRRDCFEPWSDDYAGPLFSDRRNLFTSSTVLGALCEANKLLTVTK